MTHPATAHVKRLQQEQKFLIDCIHAERKLRIKEHKRYKQRLQSKWFGTLDMIMWAFKERNSIPR